MLNYQNYGLIEELPLSGNPGQPFFGFYDPARRLTPRPAGFQELQTNIATQAVPLHRFPEFEQTRLLLRPVGFDDRPAPLPAVSVPMQAAPFDQTRLLKLKDGFVDNQTNIQTIAQPIRQFPPFDQARKLLAIPEGFADLEVKPLPAVVVLTFAAFDPARPALKVQPPFVDLETNLQTIVPLGWAFPPFDGPKLQLKTPSEWQSWAISAPAAAPAVGGDAGGSISGGYFSRKKWHALIGELAKEAHERADQLKRKKERETVAVAIRASLKAAEDADVFGVGAEPMAAIAATLEAATRATKTAEVLAHVRAIHRHVAELKRQIDENDDEEAEAVELLWLL